MLDEIRHETTSLESAGPREALPSVALTGIKGLRLPVRVADRAGRQQPTMACFDLCAAAPADGGGDPRSRFPEILNRCDRRISVPTFARLLSDIARACGALPVRLEIAFPYFVDKRAPVSGARSLLDYRAALLGEADARESRIGVRVVVPVTSLCPCSKAISRYGAHNQRSLVTITAHLREAVWIEDLIDVAEAEASCELYGLLKRPDEKYVTEKAYDQPKFVEDLVRDVALRLNHDRRVAGYTIEADYFESIHNHSAYALIRRPPAYG